MDESQQPCRSEISAETAASVHMNQCGALGCQLQNAGGVLHCLCVTRYNIKHGCQCTKQLSVMITSFQWVNHACASSRVSKAYRQAGRQYITKSTRHGRQYIMAVNCSQLRHHAHPSDLQRKSPITTPSPFSWKLAPLNRTCTRRRCCTTRAPRGR